MLCPVMCTGSRDPAAIANQMPRTAILQARALSISRHVRSHPHDGGRHGGAGIRYECEKLHMTGTFLVQFATYSQIFTFSYFDGLAFQVMPKISRSSRISMGFNIDSVLSSLARNRILTKVRMLRRIVDFYRKSQGLRRN